MTSSRTLFRCGSGYQPSALPLRAVILLMTAAVALCAVPAWAGSDRFTFGPRPRLAYTVEGLRAEGDTPGLTQKGDQVVAAAEWLLKQPPAVPEDAGQWTFYYACPEHDTTLSYRDGKHVCPKCGKEYSDERTRLAYVTRLHDLLNRHTLTLAQAWHLTGRDEFAREAYRILHRYAQLHPGWERHDRWGRTGLLAVIGGKRYSQSLDDACGIIVMAQAYDLVADWDGADPARRTLIQDQFLAATVDSIYAMYPAYDGRNNHMTWFNAAAATVGAAIGREDYLDRAVNGWKGLRAQFVNSVTAEGVWYEGATAYHFYALQAIMDTVRPARACGVDLTTVPALKKLFTAPLRLSYPNGQLPAINDSDRSQITGRRGSYEFAARTWDDPELKTFFETGRVPALGSAVYEDSGLAYLRRGTDEEAVTVVLDFGQHGGHHGHPDTAVLIMAAFGVGRRLRTTTTGYEWPVLFFSLAVVVAVVVHRSAVCVRSQAF